MIADMSSHRLFVVFAMLAVIGAVPAPQDGGVTLLEPYKTATATNGSLNAFRLKALARIDPDHPLADESNAQTLSLFGREDLIAASSKDYRATACAPINGAENVMDEISRRARKTLVVIVNESHERSEHRGFTTALLVRLRAEGYTALAMEALSNPEAGTPMRYQPSTVREPGLSYLEDEDGYYLGEAGFGRLGRTAKRLGYALVPYEAHNNRETANAPLLTQIAVREEGQASALAAWIAMHPHAKLIVHVGYSHASEVPRADGTQWMATRLRAKTGVDPLTISQTTCRGGGAVPRLVALPAEEPGGTFDLIVDHPAARFVHGRPGWRVVAGDVPFSIPAALRPARGWRVVEARPEGEPLAAVPMDRVAIRPGEDIALMLPPGRYLLRTFDPSYAPAPTD